MLRKNIVAYNKTILLYECEDISKQVKLIDAATTVAVQLNDFRKEEKEL